MSHSVRDPLLVAVLRSFFGIGSRLPLPLTRPLGAFIGRSALRLDRKDRKLIFHHIGIAFPELAPDARRALARRSAQHFGLMLAELAWMWRAPAHQIEALCTIGGIEHFENALAGGRGVMFTTGHTGNWEMLGSRLPIGGVPLTTAVRQLDNRHLNDIITRLRSMHGTEVIPRGQSAGRQIRRALAADRVIALLIDQDIRDIPGVFVPFFGRLAWTPAGAAVLALRTGCPIVPGFIHRRPDLSHHIQLHPPLEVPSEGTEEERILAVTAAATKLIEKQVRAHPEQWVWMHRRWRTRPAAEG